MLNLKPQTYLKPRTRFSRNNCAVGDRHNVVKLATERRAAYKASTREMGIGIDIASVERITNLVERYDRGTLNLLFTLGEIDRCQQAKNPYQNYTICFAAKEAVGKALGTGLAGIDWHEIEATVSEFQLKIELYGKAKFQAAKLGYTKWFASWSNCDNYVLVHVLAC